MPPFSGFIGKLLVMQATGATPAMVWIWATILITSLVAIYALSRAGSILFWKSFQLGPAPATASAPVPAPATAGGPKLEPDEPIQDLGDAPANWLAVASVVLLLSGIVALTAFAGPAMRLAEATAAQLHNPDAYVSAVLEGQEGTK